MRKTLLVSFMLAVSALVTGQARAQQALVPADAEIAQDLAAPVDETPSMWLVELASPPIVEGTGAATLAAEKASFRAAARRAGLAYAERYAYDVLWNGFSVSIAPADLGKLSRVPGVKALWPVVEVRTAEASPELATALAMTGADLAQHELGLTGTGVHVAVMDTGIDYDHPDLGGCFGPACRVAFGWDFVGDAFNADSTSPAYDPVPVPDDDPDDCQGHGTHVSGIIGARAATPLGVTGVAPDVTFGAYRVFGCEGSTTSDIMLAAMEQALADGMDVLNMSIGSAFQWPQYPTAVAADRLVNQGIVVVASIGNSGANGAYSAGAPGVGDKVIGVASFDNTHVRLTTFTVSPDDTAIGYTNATGAPPAPTSGTYVLARTGTPTTADDACAELPAGSLAGKVALIRRGTCSFHLKSLNAQNAGALGVVLYNNAAGRVNPTVAGTPAIVIPVVAVSDVEGLLIDGRLAQGPVELTWTDTKGTFLNPTGNLISSFSSYGLANDLSLKPDLGSPGGLITSTYPLERGGYATLGGTSMASPHVAGATALVLEAAPRTSPQVMRAVLQNSADPRLWWGNPGLGYLDNVHRQGAGMLDIPGAVAATTRVTPSKLALGESEAGPSAVTLTLENRGGAAVTYALSHAPALATALTFSPKFYTGFASVSFAALEVTVPAGGTATVQATITAPPGPALGQYGGYIVFTPADGAPLRVPYAGFVGDYQAIPVLVPTSYGFPWLARLSGAIFTKLDAGGTFTLAGGDVPYFLVHLDHAVRRLRVEIFEADTGRALHRAFEEDYVGRNSTTTGFFSFAWDGVTGNGSRFSAVPNGRYVARLSVLKALGDDTNPSHTETWTSPVITIARP